MAEPLLTVLLVLPKKMGLKPSPKGLRLFRMGGFRKGIQPG